MPFVAPPPALCTDNAAMIAWAGAERLAAGLVTDPDLPARPRWPLDEAAEPMVRRRAAAARAHERARSRRRGRRRRLRHGAGAGRGAGGPDA